MLSQSLSRSRCQGLLPRKHLMPIIIPHSLKTMTYKKKKRNIRSFHKMEAFSGTSAGKTSVLVQTNFPPCSPITELTISSECTTSPARTPSASIYAASRNHTPTTTTFSLKHGSIRKTFMTSKLTIIRRMTNGKRSSRRGRSPRSRTRRTPPCFSSASQRLGAKERASSLRSHLRA